MQTATAAKPSPDYRTLSPEEIYSAYWDGVEVEPALLELTRGQSIARRDGAWYITTTAALAANLWEPKDGCERFGSSKFVESCDAVLAWLEAQSDELEAGPNRIADAAAVRRASRALDDALAAWTPPAGVLALRPTVYAASAWELYTQVAARSGCALLVGMNPGPHGMMQTGVPFCDPQTLALLFGAAEAGRLMLAKAKPEVEPGSWRENRTTTGRREESARRLWNVLREVVDHPSGIIPRYMPRATQAVPLTFFAVNAFPIGLLDAAKGTNVAPSDLRLPVEVEHKVCEWLGSLIEILRPATVVSIGTWARGFVKDACSISGWSGEARHITHPSPRVGSEAAWRIEALPVLQRAHALVQEARR